MFIFLKNFIYHTFIVSLPSLFLIITFEFQFEKIDTSEIYPKYLKLLENKKIKPLDILIAGDSRAERQIIPQELKKDTLKNILNIGISSGDIVRLRDFIVNRKASKLLYNDETILIVSVSPWQINDNYQKWGYLSNSTFKFLSFTEKFKLLKNKNEYFKYVLATHKKNFKEILNLLDYKSNIDSLGYLGVEGDITKLNKNDINNMIIKLKNEYLNYENNGFRWREFKKSLDFLSTKFNKVILIINPVTDKWRRSIENTFVEKYNLEFINKLNTYKISKGFNNLIIWNFYNDEKLEIEDNYFYDTHHLNNLGAKKFSSILQNKISYL